MKREILSAIFGYREFSRLADSIDSGRFCTLKQVLDRSFQKAREVSGYDGMGTQEPVAMAYIVYLDPQTGFRYMLCALLRQETISWI